MKTAKKRINITADSDIESALHYAAKRDGLNVTTKATDLLRLALELEEDMSLAAMAEKRSSVKAKHIPHDAAWK